MKLDILSSRRLTGANLFSRRAGVVLDVEIRDTDAASVIAAWRREALALTAGFGWNSTPVARPFVNGASLFFEAPIDVLLSATDVNEIAWQRACSRLAGEPLEPVDGALNVAAGWFEEEGDQALLNLADASAAHGVSFLWDDDTVTLGLGSGSRSWPRDALPEAGSVDWSAFHDIPFAMVTGTNGKSTTVRLLASIMTATGKTVGLNSTDGIVVGGELIDEGDYAGPAGARAVLGDQRVELAAIETARGGLLRRGVALDSAPVVAITNIAEDHLGEYGIDDVEALADAKFVLTRALRSDGTLVANAEDERVATRAEASGKAIVWFSLDPAHARIRQARDRGDTAWYLEDGRLMCCTGGREVAVMESAEAPVTLGGYALYNVANCLTAAAVAALLGIDHATIRDGLAAFRSENEDNPGRGNLYLCNGARMLVDFAHNVHGIDAVAKTVRAFSSRRRLLMFGQAGHRTDTELADIADAALRLKPDRVVLTDSDKYLRGRAPMEVPELLRQHCIDHGIPAEAISLHASPLDGVRAAIDWAGDGDACLLLALGDRDAIAAELRAAESAQRTPVTDTEHTA